MGEPIFILADDLAGSADAASYFRTARRRVRVMFTEGAPWDGALGAAVVQVFDTETRGLQPDEARRRIARAVSPLASPPGSRRIFKKVDSTLRGNLGVEIETALRILGRPLAVLAPAFPANQRAVRAGHLFVNGVPVTETSYGRDPQTPVRANRVADIVRATTDLPVHEIGLDAVRAGPSHLAAALRRPAAAPRIAVCDAETQDDLDAVANAIGRSGACLACGSDGLARAVAEVWDEEPEGEAAQVPRPPARRCQAALVAVGSANPVAHQQLAVLRRATGIPVVVLRTPRLADAAAREAEATRGCEEAARSSEWMLAVALIPERPAETAEPAPRFEADLARVGLAWIESRGIRATETLGLVCTGGDTTLALVRAVGGRAIWPEGEVSPGVPWSLIEAPSRTMWLVSKAGGFGDSSSLVDAVRFLFDAREPESRR